MGSAEERIVKGEDKSGSGMSALLIAALVLGGGLVLVGGGLVLVLLTRRGKPAVAASSSSQSSSSSSSSPSPAPKSSAPASASPAAPAAAGYQPTAFFDPGVLNSKLVGLAGPLSGKEIALGSGVTLGRDPARAQVIVNDVQVSGQHVWVGPVGGKIIARESGSKNGTFLNDDQVTSITEVELKPGDILTLGGGGSVKFQLKR
jgi:hypothetical protein